MYKKTRDLAGFSLRARDGDIGHVKDFFFDDAHWTIRHIVADTGNWLPKRRVLISPIVILGILDSEKAIPVDLTKKQIKNGPSVDDDKPVSRQMEEEYHRHFGWPYYWHGPYIWGPNPFPRSFAAAPPSDRPRNIAKPKSGDPHLRSASAVKGYHIQALDDEFGHVDDFIFDDEDWVIRYIVVDTRNWWAGRKVLLSPEWLSSIDWSRSRIEVSLDRETVKRSPEYDPHQLISREYEDQLHRFYNQDPYWRAHAESVRES